MARKKSAPDRSEATLSSHRAVELLGQQLAEAERFVQAGVEWPAYDEWNQTTRAILLKAFGSPSPQLDNFGTPEFTPTRINASPSFLAARRRKIVEGKITVLKSCLKLFSLGLQDLTRDVETHETKEQIVELMNRLSFIEREDVREMLKRDVGELAVAAQQKLGKCCLLLCGSIIEAALIDVLDRRHDLAQSHLGNRRRWPDAASLADLVKIARAEDLLSQTAEGIANALTDHRDLIHPQAEIRTRITIDPETADSMIHLLKIVLRELSSAQENGAIEAYEDK